jgi:hypothetical protein
MAYRKRRKTGSGLSAAGAALSLIQNVPQVMALRLARIAHGGKRGQAESKLMISEKIAAGLQAQAIMARSWLTGSPEKGRDAVTKLYARKVAANKRRLGKG